MIVSLIAAFTIGAHAAGREKPGKDDLSLPAIPETAPKGDLKARVGDLEATVAKMEAELEILRRQNQMVIQHTHLNYNNAVYLTAGMALLLPREFTFSIATDSGLGANLGVGKYFGTHHAFELGLTWDMHLAIDAQYRFEIQSGVNRITWGPVIGYRTKIASLRPFDRFVSDPNRVKDTFYYAGFTLGMPTSGASLLRGELLFLQNSQQIITARVGVYFFL